MCRQVIKGPQEINVIMEPLHGELSGLGSDQQQTGKEEEEEEEEVEEVSPALCTTNRSPLYPTSGEHARSSNCLPSAAITDRRKERHKGRTELL